jgi:hypothetical protein
MRTADHFAHTVELDNAIAACRLTSLYLSWFRVMVGTVCPEAATAIEDDEERLEMIQDHLQAHMKDGSYGEEV